MRKELSTVDVLTALLLASAASAALIYVGTAHSYPNDGRYLSIILFAGWVALAGWLRTKQLDRWVVLRAAAIAMLSVSVGLLVVNYHASKALDNDQLARRNQAIAQAVRLHPVEVLVGDYWRVFPIKALTPHAIQKVNPLDGCLRATPNLNSTAWQEDTRQHSFAYILSLRFSGTVFPQCTLQTIGYAYGKPSSVAVIAGTRAHPTEILLFYDQGATSHHGAIDRFHPNRY